ncbi:MAG: phosphatase PAP2 family protein [Lysobacter sp.]|nr:phosphatase PAP2 family protein [Lysobacter sp.]
MRALPWIVAAAAATAGVTASLAMASVSSQTAAPVQSGVQRPLRVRDLPPGYLARGTVDGLALILPAPVKGDERYRADRRLFRATRALRNGERWRVATRDVEMEPAAMMENFSCAAGRHLAPETAPQLDRIMRRVLVDALTTNETAKRHFRRLRPFQIDRGPICQPEAQLTTSFDYPSGHTVWGWTWALVLAELVPDRATPILARGRAYGESRLVCGAHNGSAVEAGARVAAGAIAAVHGSAEFRADMDLARAELATAPMLGESARAACVANERVFAQALPGR